MLISEDPIWSQHLNTIVSESTTFSVQTTDLFPIYIVKYQHYFICYFPFCLSLSTIENGTDGSILPTIWSNHHTILTVHFLKYHSSAIVPGCINFYTLSDKSTNSEFSKIDKLNQ